MSSIDSLPYLFLTVYALAIITPGPNFILVSNAALDQTRRYGLVTAFGIATGSYLFSLAGIFGLLIIVSSWAPLENVLRFVGGGYLMWIGISMLGRLKAAPAIAEGHLNPTSSLAQAFRRGLVTNLTNPKAWAFYLSLFTLLGFPQYSLAGKHILALCMFSISLVWYGVVVLLMNSSAIKLFAGRVQKFVQGALGVVLIAMASKILLGR